MRRGAWQVRGGKIAEGGSRFSSAGGVERRGVTALSIRDYVAMVAGFLLCFTISWTLGHGRIFWEDEMLGWMLLTDPSWHHMIQAWNQGADGGGFAFYASGRIWLHLFGPSEVAFRAYSATCFGLAFAVNWMTFRRFYERWVTGFALFNTWFCSPPIVLHLVEGRFYGLLMLFASAVLWLVIRLQDSVGRTPVRLYVGFFAANAVLTTSHLLGVVYSVFLLVALVALDLLAGRRRPALYVCAAASWLLLLPERYSIEASAAVGRPWFWTVQPPLYRLLGPLTGYSGEIAAVIALLLVPLGISVQRQRGAWHGELLQAYRARRSLYVGSFALVLTAVAFLLEGFVGPSLFINRYLMPRLDCDCLCDGGGGAAYAMGGDSSYAHIRKSSRARKASGRRDSGAGRSNSELGVPAPAAFDLPTRGLHAGANSDASERGARPDRRRVHVHGAGGTAAQFRSGIPVSAGLGSKCERSRTQGGGDALPPNAKLAAGGVLFGFDCGLRIIYPHP